MEKKKFLSIKKRANSLGNKGFKKIWSKYYLLKKSIFSLKNALNFYQKNF